MGIKIKICGLTNVREAEYLNRNKADYAGIVLFYEKSRRNMTIEKAKPILEALDSSVKKVAVMVSPTAEQVHMAAMAGFDYAQIHGELKAGVMDELPVLKAFNITDMEHYEYYRNCPQIAGYVFDAFEPGSGKSFDWKILSEMPRDGKLFMLAGGLNPENVEKAVISVRPDAVDVSTGVEYAEGGKNPELIDSFIANARRAFAGSAGQELLDS